MLTELRDLTVEPKVRNKYRLTVEVLDEFFEKLSTTAVLVETVPSVFEFSRDPDDAHYVDLAVAAGAKLIVSRDKDLLSLTDQTTADGRDFQ